MCAAARISDTVVSVENRANHRHLGVSAWAALLRTQATVLRVLEREVEGRTGLPLTWYDVLLELSAVADRQLRMQQLSERVVLSRTRVSRLVDDMVAAGFVEKRPDPGDGRATLAAITSQGRAALRRAAPVYLQGIEEHFVRHLDAEQLVAITQGLKQVLDAHGGESHPQGCAAYETSAM